MSSAKKSISYPTKGVFNNTFNAVKQSNDTKPPIVTFFEALFPWKSYIELRFIKAGEPLIRKWMNTHEIGKMLNEAHLYSNKGYNAYFGVAARHKHGGTKQDLDYVNALWIDLDCEKERRNKEECVEKLQQWILPPSIIIDSGHGLHVYWLLKEPTKEFDLIEHINIGLAKALGGDKVAYDATRILRIPTTKNWKNEPIPVEIIHIDVEKRYDLTDFDEWIDTTQIYDKDSSLSVDVTVPSEIVDQVINECAFLKYCKENARTLEEPYWYAMITNLVALGATDKIHELSKPYHKDYKRKYTPEETNKKIEHALKDAPGPHTCQYIQNVLGFKCPDTCPWKSRVKSPAGIAWKLLKPERKLPFTVLGFTLDKKIYVWYKGNLINFNTNRLTRDELTLFLGNISKETYYEIKETILLAAHEKGLIDTENTIKKGIFKFDDGFLINTGKNALLIQDGKITILNEPVFKGKIITFDKKEFLDTQKFMEYYKTTDITEIFSILHSLIAQWNFEDGEMPQYLTAFVMLAPFQHAMKWRPWIYLTGRRGTGKTTFFDEVLGIFENLTVRLDKSTAHAIVQEIGNTGKIAVFDEFENYKKLDEILEIAKLSNAGGAYTRGTTSEKMKKWNLHHMLWFGSIYPAGKDAAQRSRTVFFELLPHETKSPTFLTRIEKEELKHRIIASVIKHWNEIEAKAFEYQKNKTEYDVQDGRIIDNFMYAAALVDIATGEGGIPEFAQQIRFEEDEEKLLTTILTTVIENKQIYTHLINGNSETCEKYGLKKIYSHEEEYLAIYPKQVKRYLLKDTYWADLDISKPLLRLSAYKQKQTVKLNGKSQRAIIIPWNIVQQIMED